MTEVKENNGALAQENTLPTLVIAGKTRLVASKANPGK